MTTHERYQVGCSTCGHVDVYDRRAVAIDKAAMHLHHHRHDDHDNPDVTIFDRMARRGAAQEWSTEGAVLNHRGWE